MRPKTPSPNNRLDDMDEIGLIARDAELLAVDTLLNSGCDALFIAGEAGQVYIPRRCYKGCSL